MTVDDTKALAVIIKANRFHFGSAGIKKLADHFESVVLDFDRKVFYYQIDKTVPKLGACSCKPGISRDNCPQCEGTGKAIDFAKLRLCMVA